MNLPSIIKTLDPEIHLKKHTATIHYKGTLSNVDHKVLNILYKCAYDSDNFSSEQYYIRISDIVSFLGWQKSKFEDIRKALQTLRDSGFEWNIFEQDKKNKEEWDVAGGSGFISDYMISKHDEIATFSVPPILRRLLKTPNIYAHIDLKVQKSLRGKYDLIYYEYFLDELYRNGTKEAITRWYSVPDLRRLLNLSGDMYQEFKIFNHNCIKEPLAAINEHSDINVEIHDVLRTQRKVSAIKFKVCFKSATKEDIQTELSLNENSILEQAQYDVLHELTTFYGEIPAKKIIEEISIKYPDCYEKVIFLNIEYAKRQNMKGTIQSLPAFMRKAIDEDYAGYIKKVKEYQRGIEQEKLNAAKLKEEDAKQEKLNQEYIKMQKEFDSLPETTKNILYDKCRQSNSLFSSLPEGSQYSIAVEMYIQNKESI